MSELSNESTMENIKLELLQRGRLSLFLCSMFINKHKKMKEEEKEKKKVELKKEKQSKIRNRKMGLRLYWGVEWSLAHLRLLPLAWSSSFLTSAALAWSPVLSRCW